MSQGMFIVIDGTDGSGKATQLARLSERLRREEYDVVTEDFPQYGKPSAYFLEKYLRGEYGTAHDIGPYRASVFFALDRFDACSRIRSSLAEGKIVVSNRYVSANKGHQMSHMKTPEEQRAFLEWLNHFEYTLLGIPKPDATIFLHVPADIGYDLIAQKSSREHLHGKSRDILEADREHQRAAERAYLLLAEQDTSEHWHTVECTENGELLSIESIHQKVWEVVHPLIIKQHG